ncbi:MAG: hypothetical protein JWO06_2097, partial [Bacteroidota bacterium]|nr:hypothetical protein [Bacteroidota bacterium]
MKKLLRFFLALALILQLAGKLNAQYFALPDSGLYNWLNTHGCSSCLSPPNFLDTVCAGNFSCSTCVLTMTMDNANIHNLSGIQFFKNLAQLSCSVNHLTFIPPLPPLVEYLRCDNNPLDSLPPLSPPMSRLFCSFTHIKRLPSLPASMNQLYIGYDSLLTDVDNLPRDLGDLLITSDPSLTCLPYIHSITGAFSLRHTPIGCFANYPNNFSSDVPLHSIPLCWVYNPNNCYAYTNLTGTFYKDDNHNCTMDSGENGLGNCKMMLKQNGSLLQICYTNAQGVYAFSGSTPNSYQVEVDTSNLPFSVTCPVGGVDSVTLSTQHPYDTLLNFAAECGSSFDLAGYNLMAYRLRAGVVNDVLFRAGDMANFFNTICASGISGQVQLIF